MVNSKKTGEDLLFNYNKETGAKVWFYRLQNLFWEMEQT